MPHSVRVRDLYEALSERLNLDWVAGRSGADEPLLSDDIDASRGRRRLLGWRLPHSNELLVSVQVALAVVLLLIVLAVTFLLIAIFVDAAAHWRNVFTVQRIIQIVILLITIPIIMY